MESYLNEFFRNPLEERLSVIYKEIETATEKNIELPKNTLDEYAEFIGGGRKLPREQNMTYIINQEKFFPHLDNGESYLKAFFQTPLEERLSGIHKEIEAATKNNTLPPKNLLYGYTEFIGRCRKLQKEQEMIYIINEEKFFPHLNDVESYLKKENCFQKDTRLQQEKQNFPQSSFFINK